MEIIKFEKKYTIDGKCVPKFSLQNDPETVLFDDIHYNIVKYLGNIQGLLNKNLRKLWLRNDGIIVSYSRFWLLSAANFLKNNITTLHVKFAHDIDIKLITKLSRLEKVFIKDISMIHITILPASLNKLNLCLRSIAEHFPNFKGVFLDIDTVYFAPINCKDIHDRFRSIIERLEKITLPQNLINVFSEYRGYRIWSSLEEFKRYCDFINNVTVKEGEFVLFYLDLFSKFEEMSKIGKHIKKIKVLAVDDSDSLNYYYNVFVPAYQNIGIILDLVIIGHMDLYSTRKIRDTLSTNFDLYDRGYKIDYRENRAFSDYLDKIDIYNYLCEMIGSDLN